MFEKRLADKLRRIFDIEKVTYDRSGESREQEAIFIEVESSRNRIKDAREIAKVTGALHVFAPSEKLKYGYFSKAIADADPADTKDIYFYEFEENLGTYRNIVERKLQFIYLYDSQYDPNIGELTSVNLSYPEP